MTGSEIVLLTIVATLAVASWWASSWGMKK
jgi:hypothetical protein